MAENFLSTDEVDALLRGVAEVTDGAGGTGNPLDPGHPHGLAAGADHGEVRPYDLASQDRIARGRMPALDLVNDRFGRLLRAALSGFLNRSLDVSAGPVQIQRYGEFTRKLPMPTSLNLVLARPLRGTALVVLDPSLVFLMVDNLFGGDGRFHTQVAGREFTRTEQRIIERVLGLVLQNYAKSWEPVYRLQFEALRSETKAEFVHIASPRDMVVTTTVTVALGPASGELHLCMPYAMVEPIRALLGSIGQGERPAVDARWLQRMTHAIQAAEVEMVVDLGTAQMTLGAIMNMKEGDVIPLAVADTVEAKVDGIAVMACTYGKLNGQYAIRVERHIPSSNRREPAPGDDHGR